MSKKNIRIALLVIGLLLAVAIQRGYISNLFRTRIDTGRRIGTVKNLNALLGNPSKATADSGNRNNYLIERPQYVVSYNDSKGGPNWVSWHLKASDIGKEQRGEFHPDNDLPSGFKVITPSDYTHSGYDRGHMCNSKDRTDTREDDDATFLMTNMLPQTGDLNRGPWEKLESYCRTLVFRENDLYIIAGGYGSRETIARGAVNVPAHCWKVVVVLPKGSNDFDGVNANTRVIAVDMPNVEGIKQDDWQKYITTVKAIERATGYDLLSALPDNVRATLETKKDG